MFRPFQILRKGRTRSRRRFAFALVVAIAALGAASARAGGVAKITRLQFGHVWPFTVSAGVLACNLGAVTFSARGTTYAINGTALDENRYVDLRRSPIWRPAPHPLFKGQKIDIGPIIDRGLKLCR